MSNNDPPFIDYNRRWSNAEYYPVRVYDPFGRLVFMGQTTTIDLSNQTAGVYTIECLGDTVKHARIILIR